MKKRRKFIVHYIRAFQHSNSEMPPHAFWDVIIFCVAHMREFFLKTVQNGSYYYQRYP